MPPPSAPLSPPRLLALGMAGVILAGTVLLSLPLASTTGASIGPLKALFTATSAVCVTGLVVVDTPNAFSGTGQVIVMLLIQIGGLGYMAASTLVAIALGRRLGLHSQLLLQESLNLSSRRDLMQFAGTVFKLTLAFEGLGALVLTLHWWGDYGFATAAWQGVFHAVSAFNNAGFSLFSTNLIGSRGDVIVNLTICALIVSGGIGYLVLTELFHYRKNQPLSLHSRLVVTMTLMLIVGGAVAIYLLERGNAASLGGLPRGEAWLAAFFQSVTTRTAGFNTVDLGAFRPATLFLMILLMFIGAAPGGTGGGVKVSTFGVTVLALWATIRGYREPTLFRRRLPGDLVARAFFVSLTAFLALNVVTGMLLITEGGDLLRTLFESTSAFGTVGLSTGLIGTPVSLAGGYSTTGQLLLCALMFLGRVGPLTVAFALAGRSLVSRVRYPEGRVLIG